MKQKINIILFLLFAVSAHAATIYEVPNDRGLWDKIMTCTWHLSCYFQQNLGATITVINGTDRITDSRAVINTNYANINSELLGTLTPARLTATSTSASSSIAWGLEIYQRALAIGTTASTTLRATATSSFNGGISTTGSLDVQSTSATSTFANGISLARGCITMPDGSCAITSGITGSGVANQVAYFSSATAIAGNSNFTVNTAVGGFIATNGTTTNATTTAFQVSGLASTSQAIIGTLGVGIATTTQRNAQIAGDVQVSGNLSVGSVFSLSTTTGSQCSGCINTSVVTATGSGPNGADASVSVSATCAAGYWVTGGGGGIGGGSRVFLFNSNPIGSTTWRVTYKNDENATDNSAQTITAYAICAKP